jgi:hypothetical protein
VNDVDEYCVGCRVPEVRVPAPDWVMEAIRRPGLEYLTEVKKTSVRMVSKPGGFILNMTRTCSGN